MDTSVYPGGDLLATRGQRFGNFIIDLIMRYVLIFIFGFIAGLLALAGYDGLLLWIDQMSFFDEILLGSAFLLVYYVTMEVLSQRTVGKYITGTKVIMADGSKPEARIIVVRSLCRFIPFEIFSFLGEDGRGWHDTITETFVVNAKKYEAALNLKNSFEEIGTTEQ